MANLDKFKEAGRKFEQKEQWSKAIEQYLKAVEAMEKSPEDDTDLSLYNRVGDLYQKAADTQLDGCMKSARAYVSAAALPTGRPAAAPAAPPAAPGGSGK